MNFHICNPTPLTHGLVVSLTLSLSGVTHTLVIPAAHCRMIWLPRGCRTPVHGSCGLDGLAGMSVRHE